MMKLTEEDSKKIIEKNTTLAINSEQLMPRNSSIRKSTQMTVLPPASIFFLSLYFFFLSGVKTVVIRG